LLLGFKYVKQPQNPTGRVRRASEPGRRVPECRYFSGYIEEQTAEALAVSSRTVERDWLRAKAWLRGAMLGEVGVRRRSHTTDM